MTSVSKTTTVGVKSAVGDSVGATDGSKVGTGTSLCCSFIKLKTIAIITPAAAANSNPISASQGQITVGFS